MEKTLTHILLESRYRNKKNVAVKCKHSRHWINYSWQEYFDHCELVGCALLAMGIEPGDHVAILSNTRSEWLFTDLGILGANCITVPLYQSSLPDEAAYIINDSQAKVLFCEDKVQVDKWLKIRQQCPHVEYVVCFTRYDGMPNSVISWEALKDNGARFREENPNSFALGCEKNTKADIATIIYTSGTTGQPKGVVLTHRQIMSELEDVFGGLGVTENDVTLTFLPFAHILGRVEGWGGLYKGYTVAFAESIERLRFNMRKVRPTVLIAVPRIFEKIRDGIINQVEASRIKRQLFFWALDVGKQVSQAKRDGRAIPLHLLGPYRLAKKLVFSSVHEKLGGRLRFAMSGGAPLSAEVAEFFHALDILIVEGYGLTETTAAITVNTPLEYKFGTVGKPLPDVTISLAEDGEILVKSDKVMREYYNNPEATAEVIKDGFFATGDIGEFTEDGFLKITDRKKDLIKTAGGKYVAPQKIESALKNSRYISNVLVHGDKRKYIVALVTLDQETIEKYALDREISHQDFGSLSQHPEIYDLIREEIAEANENLASHETIKNFAILPHDFTIESGELTPSLKVKRKFCDQKYAEQLDALYGLS